jgi:hypothetical protein
MKRITILQTVVLVLMLSTTTSAQFADRQVNYQTTYNIDNIATTTALSGWATVNYLILEEDAQRRYRFTAGVASYILVDSILNRNSEPSISNSLAAFLIATTINVAVGFGMDGWKTERAIPSAFGATAGFVASYSIRF